MKLYEVSAQMDIIDLLDRLDGAIPKSARLEIIRLRTKLTEADAKDAELINWLETEMYDLRCISVPTGGDDYCEHWEVISHHMAKPNERTEGYGKTPREAIRAAIAAERK